MPPQGFLIFKNELVYLIGAVISIIYALMFWKICHVVNDFEKFKNMIELNKIYNEDCLEGMKRIPDKSVDMILCDLPYGTTACKWDTVIPFEPLWEQYKRIIKVKIGKIIKIDC